MHAMKLGLPLFLPLQDQFLALQIQVNLLAIYLQD